MHAHQDPQVHLQLHRDRVEVGVAAARHRAPRRARPPSRARRELAVRLRLAADRLDPAAMQARRA